MSHNRRIAASPKKNAKRPPLIEQVDELLQQSADLGRQILTGIETSAEEGMINSSMAREAANIMRAITAISTELRQREKHAIDYVNALNPDQRHELIAEYIKELGKDERGKFLEILEGGKSKGVL